MSFPSDLAIARAAKLEPLTEIGASIGLGPHLLEPYGEHVAKIKLEAIEDARRAPNGQAPRPRRTPKRRREPTRCGDTGPRIAGLESCWAADEREARKVAMRWTNEVLPGKLAQELALPSDFEAVGTLVTEDMMAELFPLGPDPDRWVKAVQAYVDAGYDEIYLSQMGDDQAGFLRFDGTELAPRLRLD